MYEIMQDELRLKIEGYIKKQGKLINIIEQLEQQLVALARR